MNPRYGQNRTPSQEEAFSAAVNAIMSGFFVALPGKVEKYNPITQQAEVKPLLQRAYVDNDGNEDVDKLPAMQNVPVLFPRAGGFFLTMPVKKGDNVLLIFCDRSIDGYMASTGAVDLDPIDLREHDISDAVAIPGFFPTPKAIKDDVSTDAVFGKEKGNQVRVKNSGVEVTTAGAPTASDFVAMAAKVDAFIQVFDTVMRVGWTPVPTDGGAALKAAYLAAFAVPPVVTASTNLKAD
jgi:hypothetical protein